MEFTLLVEWSYGSSIYKERKDNRSHLAQNHLTVALYSLKTCFLFFFHPFISIGSYEQGSSAPERNEASRSFSA